MRPAFFAVVALLAMTACNTAPMALAAADASAPLAQILHPHGIVLFSSGYGDPISIVTSDKGLIFIADDVGGMRGPAGVYRLAGGATRLIASTVELHGSTPLALSFQKCATASGTVDCGLYVTTKRGEIFLVNPL